MKTLINTKNSSAELRYGKIRKSTLWSLAKLLFISKQLKTAKGEYYVEF